VGCSDINECAVNNGGCDPLTECNNTFGGRNCTACPLGYTSASGTGSTRCTDLDECVPNPCFNNTACIDAVAPEHGFTCFCPEWWSGNGVNCTKNNRCVDATPLPCSVDPEVSCVDLDAAGVVCGACPEGYSGDRAGTGTFCNDVDECALQLCDPLTLCSNYVAGFNCTGCPEGYRGTGKTECVEVETCRKDNGGCHFLQECTDTQEGPECGGCPPGYIVSEGGIGCEDEDACLEGVCFEGVACVDMAPPKTGFTCGNLDHPCPVGMLGDGLGPNATVPDKIGCYEDLCFTRNGGCAPQVTCANDPSTSSGVLCSTCPDGYSDTKGDGTVCDDANGCDINPCYPGVLCTDVPVPASSSSRTCGDCPTGLEGDGATCTDIDECAYARDEGAVLCWTSTSSDGVVLSTSCLNKPYSSEFPLGYVCSSCAELPATGEAPIGYKGDGLKGCRISTDCSFNNGGCWTGSAPYQDYKAQCSMVGGNSECGECAEDMSGNLVPGFQGDGDVSCTDIDACADAPCFPGVSCNDTLAPGTGFTCGDCPEGFYGDGLNCTMCNIEIGTYSSIKDGGTESRAGWYRNARSVINAEMPTIWPELPICIKRGGLRYRWDGSVSDGTKFNLTDDVNKAHTLKLSIYKASLQVRLSYMFSITAWFELNPTVSSTSTLSFYVESQDLNVVIAGGDVIIGQDNMLQLDALSSVDPDGERGDITYSWTCARVGSTAPCRAPNGERIEVLYQMDIPAISLQLNGSYTGALYTFQVIGIKGPRSNSASTQVTIMRGSPPVPTIQPKVEKINANEKLSLNATIKSEDVANLQLFWEVANADNTSTPFVMGPDTISGGTTGANLVVRANQLLPGDTYVFTLAATDRGGSGSGSLSLTVNTPPRGGRAVVDPVNGTVHETPFVMMAHGWVDDDTPLTYQFFYRVLGDDEMTADQAINTEFAILLPPNNALPPPAMFMRRPGVPAMNYSISVTVRAADALGAVASAETFITVLDGATMDTSAVMGDSMAALSNGDADTAIREMTAVADALNDISTTSGTARRRRRLLAGDSDDGVAECVQDNSTAAGARRLAQIGGDSSMRESMIGGLDTANGLLFPTSASVEVIASSSMKVLGDPCALSGGAQGTGLSLIDTLVASTLSPEAKVTQGSSDSITNSLDSLNQAGNAGTNGSMDASHAAAASARVMSSLAGLGGSLLTGVVAGEEAPVVQSATLSMCVQRSTTDGTADVTAPLCPALAQAGGGAPAQLPSSIGGAVGGKEVSMRLMATTTEIHSQAGSPQLGNSSTGNVSAAGGVVSLVLMGGGGDELPINDLSEGIEVSLPLANENRGTVGELRERGVAISRLDCTFWSEALGTYMTEGCAQLPNPAPPAPVVIGWKSLRLAEFAFPDMAWEVQGPEELVELCRETYDPIYPEYAVRLPPPQAQCLASTWQARRLASTRQARHLASTRQARRADVGRRALSGCEEEGAERL
ncbi:hypothetical protein CYMTET_20324, partial [Cymbomonas tetramitiformis]